MVLKRRSFDLAKKKPLELEISMVMGPDLLKMFWTFLVLRKNGDNMIQFDIL